MSKENSKKFNGYKRARYFHGQLLSDSDFRDEQVYLNEKRKLHNRLIQGSGVVSGLKIEGEEGESKFKIKKGFALDKKGNEVYVDQEITVNISDLDLVKSDGSICQTTESKDGTKYYVVIKYYEEKTDFVPVYAPGGGCDEKVCDYARFSEGYYVQLKEQVELDCDYTNDKLCDPETELPLDGLLYPLPDECDSEEGVVLGSITLNSGNITTDGIDNWDGRKYVMTFGLLAHWMDVLGTDNVPFEAIVRYCVLGDSSITPQQIKDYLCPDTSEAS